MEFNQILVWLKNENWFVLVFGVVGVLNIIIAGARAMGWSYLADECLKIENALKAMVDAAKNNIFNVVQKKG